jgi:hypothetical protein
MAQISTRHVRNTNKMCCYLDGLVRRVNENEFETARDYGT